VPLSEVARVELVSGASFIYREQQERYIPIKFSVRGRDLGGAVLEAQQRVAAEVLLPPGDRLEWVGEFGNLQDAIKRLTVIVPVTILLIGVLLYIDFASWIDTLLGIAVIPMAMVGGIFALYATETPFSVSAAIGFIALFGIAVMEGIILLSYYNQLIDASTERAAAILRACQTSSGDDDLQRGVCRIASRGAVDRHRRPGTASVGARRGGRHPLGSGARARRAAGPHRFVLEEGSQVAAARHKSWGWARQSRACAHQRYCGVAQCPVTEQQTRAPPSQLAVRLQR
jgi:hypothetical protein